MTSRRCVLDSASSGLWHLGFNNLAWFCMSTNETKGLEAMDFFQHVCMTRSTKEQRQLFEICTISRKRLKKWDTLRDAGKFMLCLLGIVSSDGKTDHAICIVGNWIFDSNFERALPLTRESLDICASSADRYTVFTGVTRGILLRRRN